MPPRRSQRQKQPSAQAVEAIAATPCRRAKRPRSAAPSDTEAPGSQRTDPEVPGSQQTDPTMGDVIPPAPLVLPPGAMEQLVSTVTAEVTKSLLPYLSQSPAATLPGVPRADPVPMQHLTEAALGAQAVGSAAAVVQDALQSAHAMVTGEPLSSSHTPPMPQVIFQSVNMPVDARVPAKIRTKIWNNEYIEFGSLLLNPVLDGKMQINIQSAEGSNLPSLSLEPVSKPKKITSIDVWTSAFHIFVGVYTGKYPAEAPSLMKYGEIVKDLAARGNHWKYYDENFRFLRQSSATSLPWGDIHWELWLRSQSPAFGKGHNSSVQSYTKQGQLPLVPKGFCFKFHRGLDCSGCAFKHICFKCDGHHRAIHCNFRGQKRNSSSSTSRAAKPPATNTGKR